jgi:hypothetical protein
MVANARRGDQYAMVGGDLGVGMDGLADECFDSLDALVERGDQVGDVGLHVGIEGLLAMLLLVGPDVDQLVAPAHQRLQALAFGTRSRLRRRPVAAAVVGEHACIQPVGFGALRPRLRMMVGVGGILA